MFIPAAQQPLWDHDDTRRGLYSLTLLLSLDCDICSCQAVNSQTFTEGLQSLSLWYKLKSTCLRRLRSSRSQASYRRRGPYKISHSGKSLGVGVTKKINLLNSNILNVTLAHLLNMLKLSTLFSPVFPFLLSPLFLTCKISL